MKGHIIGCFTAFQKDDSGHKANADKNLEWCCNKGLLEQRWFKRLFITPADILKGLSSLLSRLICPRSGRQARLYAAYPCACEMIRAWNCTDRELGIGLCRDFCKFQNPFSYQLMWSFYRSKSLLLPPIFLIHTHTCMYTPYIYLYKWDHPSQGLLFSPPGRKSCELIRTDVSADESLAVAWGPTRWQPSDFVKEHMASVC